MSEKIGAYHLSHTFASQLLRTNWLNFNQLFKILELFVHTVEINQALKVILRVIPCHSHPVDSISIFKFYTASQIIDKAFLLFNKIKSLFRQKYCIKQFKDFAKNFIVSGKENDKVHSQVSFLNVYHSFHLKKKNKKAKFTHRKITWLILKQVSMIPVVLTRARRTSVAFGIYLEEQIRSMFSK